MSQFSMNFIVGLVVVIYLGLGQPKKYCELLFLAINI
jgi:hypothetical protein